MNTTWPVEDSNTLRTQRLLLSDCDLVLDLRHLARAEGKDTCSESMNW
jgi:hypothetical protein